MVTQSAEANRWSIAIHGGAGPGSDTWGGDKREARLLGLRHALAAGRNVLAEGGSALDAVEAAVVALEDDGNFHAGLGSTVNALGNLELDAAIMGGRAGACGAVAAISVTQNPIRVARRVMVATEHVMLVGEGADAFALREGFPQVAPEQFHRWRPQAIPDSMQRGEEPPEMKFGTVGAVARDRDGNLAAATSTSGTNGKLAGRVGDSPIIGAGTFAANDAGAVSTTGLGEEFIRRCVAYDLIAQVRYAQRTLADATETMMRRTLPPSSGGVIAIDSSGEIILAHNTPGMSWGAADDRGRFDLGFTEPQG